MLEKQDSTSGRQSSVVRVGKCKVCAGKPEEQVWLDLQDVLGSGERGEEDQARRAGKSTACQE